MSSRNDNTNPTYLASRRQRIQEIRATRAVYDAVPLSGPRPRQPQPPASANTASLSATAGAPMYRFETDELLRYDMQTQRGPASVTARSAGTAHMAWARPRPQGFLESLAAPADGADESGLPAQSSSTQAIALSFLQDTHNPTDPDELLMLSIQQATERKPPSVRHAEAAAAAQPPVAPNDEEEIVDLATADDVVSFFSARASSNTSSAVKFVYCNRSPPTLQFRPYDLVVARKGKLAPEHFVVSASGVVQVVPGQPAEVVSLAEWMRESAMFNMLRRVRFFRHYLVLKAFSQWRRNIRLRVYCQTRAALCKRFVLSKATFAGTTMELIGAAHTLTTVPLLHLDPHGKHDYTIEDFAVEQQRQRTKAAAEIGGVLDGMESKLQALANKVQKDATVPDFSTMESLEQFLLAEAVANSKDKKQGTKKMKSMLEARQEQLERMRDLKRSMAEYALLDSYIRLIDYAAAEAVFRNALQTVLRIQNTVEKQLDTGDATAVKTVGFQILIQPSEDAMTFRPAEQDVHKIYMDTVDEIIQTAQASIRLMNQKNLKMFFARPPRLWGIGQECKRDGRITLSKQRMDAIIKGDFNLAQRRVASYDGNRQWVTFIQREWPEIRERWKAASKPLSSAEIAELYDRIAAAQESFKQLIPTNVGYMLFINAGRLKAELQPRIDAIRLEIDQTLRVTARVRTSQLQAYYKAKIALLNVSDKAIELTRFAKFVSDLNEVMEQANQLFDDEKEAESLFALMLEQGVDIDDEDKQLRERTLGGSQQSGQPSFRQQLTEVLTRAQEFREERRPAMVDALLIEIERVSADSNDNVQLLNDDEFTQPVTTDRRPHDPPPEYEAARRLEEIEERLRSLQDKAVRFSHWQQLFETPVSTWRDLQQFKQLFDARKEVWTLQQMFDERRYNWWTTPLNQLDTPEIEGSVKELFQRTNKVSGLMRQENYIDTVADELMAQVKDMKQTQLAIIVDCGNANMMKDHWTKILDQIPQGGVYKDDLCLRDLEACDIWSYREIVAEQSATATGEANLTKALAEIRRVWDATDFQAKRYKDDRDVYILDKVDEILQQLDDHQVQLQTIMASRFVGSVRARVEDWMAKLRVVADVIEEWITMQKSWMYLEFIFAAEDIKVQLKEESERFDQVDRMFRDIMNKAVTVRNVLSICTADGLLNRMRANNKAIDEIQKRLEDYLETKRVSFPRFYFLSNDELLSILSDVRNPRAVQPHLSKCFDSISALVFSKDTEISGMRSGEGEEVPFEHPVHPTGAVDMWLGVIERTMKTSLHAHMRDTYDAYTKRVREEWFFEFPAQCVQAVDMIFWTAEVEAAVLDQRVPQYHAQYQKQLLATVDLVRQRLTKLQRSLVGTLIVVDVHNRDIVGRLVDAKVTDVADFEWVQQLRYYWEPDPALQTHNVGVHHASAHLWYGYEYLGNQPRLVITPLTDRAFLTCTNALSMNLGAAPQGPAGTGKTESVKDLGKALARQVVVFNCSDGINYKTMSRMFAGLAQAGAWACFDEFNRIELEVLSVIAQQMLEITTALSQKVERMDFDGHQIKLSKNFGVFITMNPGYAGRTELPDNLKALFRPICMMIPDYALIAEIMFYSEGFTNARNLAQKMVQLYKLSSEQLSKQDHYDFGMRAVKSILVMAGGLKRANPTDSEDMLLIRAMRDSNVPKFLRDDTVLFMALVKDLFPTTQLEEKENTLLLDYLKRSTEAQGLQAVSGFLTKAMQLFDTLVVRHGVMMVGQTMCAKTAIIETMRRALTKVKEDGHDQEGNVPLYNTVKVHTLNPKSVSMGELYGEVNEMTREWTDGLLSNIARQVKDESNRNAYRQWIVFDGPVDAVWIENMNTVLDDNKMLCLFNGERIKLPPTATFMFEVQDLKVASPATVSRCGMVYVEPYYLEGDGWRPVARTLAASLAKNCEGFRAARAMDLLEKFAPPLLKFLRQSCSEYIPTVDAQLVVSFLKLLQGFVAHAPDWETIAEEIGDTAAATAASDGEAPKLRLPSKVHGNQDAINFDLYAIVAVAWSFGANIADGCRGAFDEFVKPLLRQFMPNAMNIFAKLPPTTTVFDLCVHAPSASFVPWSTIVPDFQYVRGTPYFELFVPTAESTSLRTIMNVLLQSGRNVLVNGVTGTGKSAIIQDFLTSTLKGDDPHSSWEYFATALSAQTRSIDVQERIESKLSKIKQTLLGAAPGKRAIFFVDDLNMPSLEQYGASPPMEMLRQVLSQGGFYDRKKQPAVFKDVQDLMIIGACGVPGGGRNEITKRLTSRFHMICQQSVPTPSLRRIYETILNGFLSEWSATAPDVASLGASLVEATRQCYERITLEKLPTPTKSHYTFNLRDFGKVIQGMLQVSPLGAPDRASVVRLFLHEVTRVFHDRLVDELDTTWWWATLGDVTRDVLGVNWDAANSDLLFGDYMSRPTIGGGHELRPYEQVADAQVFQARLGEFLTSYNIETNQEMELVFFKDAASHISRICRICRQPRGNALLVGVGGSGRQTLTRLAAFICGMPVFQVAVTRNFGVPEFRECLKVPLIKAGCENIPVVFLLADTQIVKEQFLEDVNNVLNTGEVPGLLNQEDLDGIVEAMRPIMRQLNKPETRASMLAQFVQTCRDNFHIVVTMSPVGEALRRRLRMFPSLVNCTTIDWFNRWPTDALHSVALRKLAGTAVGEEHREAVAELCVRIHEDVQQESTTFFEELRRHNYTTPTSYLELLSSYARMLDEQGAHIDSQARRLHGGLEKLQQTQQMVDEMKQTLVKLQPQLEVAAQDTERIMAEVDQQQREAEVIRAACSRDEAAAAVVQKQADKARAECQTELDIAMPSFYKATEALSALNPRDLSEVRTLGQPPNAVRDVVEAVLVLLQQKDVSWANCRLVLGRPNLLSELRDFKRDDIPEKVVRQLQNNYISVNKLEPEIIAKSSVACKSLCEWVLAINNYHGVSKNIKPKRAELEAAEGRMAEANNTLKAARERLAEGERKVQALKKTMQENIDKKKRLEDEMALTELRLGRAEKLMSGLASEHVRWAEGVVRFGDDRRNLVGSMLLAAAAVAYLGPFTAPFRERMTAAWAKECAAKKIPVSGTDFSLGQIADPVKVRQWSIKGLPTDAFSVENGVIVTRSQRWCLCVDPQGQANSWIRAMERDNNLKIIKLSDANYLRTLENAIKVGLPVLLENVDETIDAVLDPVLLRQTYRHQGQLILRLGDNEVPYEPSFRFYITTKLPNPHFMPELQIKVTVVNFTVTQRGLEDQLLADVVRFERADLEQRADTTIVEIADGKQQLTEIESRILTLLATSTGNILDDDTLINTLQDAKQTSASVSEKLQIAEATQRDIQVARNRYRTVATRGSLIFSTISEIGSIEHMYQYSLDFFKKLFVQTLRRTERNPDVDARVQSLLPAVTLAAYSTICRGLFEKDKQLFSFLIFGHVFRESGMISEAEWSFFLRGASGGGTAAPADADEGQSWPEWSNATQWTALVALCESVPAFAEFQQDIWASLDEWAQWAASSDAYRTFPPSMAHFSVWHRLLVLRVFRDDLIVQGINECVSHYLGAAFAESPSFNLDGCFEDSTPTAPIIFVLTPGTDPTALFTEFAERRGFGDRKLMLSLGQDQGPKAQEMINVATRTGMWVYLQNCHVYASWMPALERILEDVMLREVHKDFRLWLTTMPTPSFPVLVLQSGVKVTKEPPQGLKANLRDSFLLEVNDDLWESVTRNGTAWRRLLFSMSFFHAVIQERRKFGALGWNIPYEWNQSDFSAAVKSLATYVSSYAQIPWGALRYLVGVINYGGRVTDFLDARCEQTLLQKFFDPTVIEGGCQHNFTNDGVYCIPNDIENLRSVTDYLANLPPYEAPELFGLHNNADITFNRNASRRQLETLLSVQPRAAGAGGSTDAKVFELAAEFLSRLPEPIDKAKAHADTYRLTADGTMTSLGTVVGQEIDVFNMINQRTKDSLVALQRAIRGEVVMDGVIEATYKAFLLGRVPASWHTGSYLSRKPLASWMEDTIARIEFLRDWNDNGVPTSFWLSGFFFPQGFLTGVLQTHSRSHKLPIDTIKFRTHVTQFATPDQISGDIPEDGVFVHGMYVEGARWNADAGALAESLPGELYTPMPVVWLQPVVAAEAPEVATTYSCPVYKTSSRAGALSTTGLSTNFVLPLDLPSGAVDPSHWILRGVALLCMLDD